MRYLTQIEGKDKAETLVAYLLTQSVATHIEPVGEDHRFWEVWIRDEEAVAKANGILREYQSNPDDPKFAAAVSEAYEILKRKQESVKAAQKNNRPVKYRSTTSSGLGTGRIPPLTLTLTIICVVVSLLTNFTDPRPGNKLAHQIMNKLGFVSLKDYVESGEDPSVNIRRGEIWRAVTPVFLHGSPFHLFMNMLGLVMLGRFTEQLVGTSRYAVMILLLAAIPMLIACLMPPNLDGSPLTVGISGVVYGLASFLWLVGMQRPDLGFRIPGTLIALLLATIFLGFANVIGGISNWGHLGGFVVGMALAAMYR